MEDKQGMSVDGMMTRSSVTDRGSFGLGNIHLGLLRWIETRSDIAVDMFESKPSKMGLRSSATDRGLFRLKQKMSWPFI